MDNNKDQKSNDRDPSQNQNHPVEDLILEEEEPTPTSSGMETNFSFENIPPCQHSFRHSIINRETSPDIPMEFEEKNIITEVSLIQDDPPDHIEVEAEEPPNE